MINFDTPIFVHTDVWRGLIAAKRAGATIKSGSVQRDLIEFLTNKVEGGKQELLFPAFNYNYGESRNFNVDLDPIQVGSLIEWLRKTGSMYRSQVPFFSFLSGKNLNLDTTKTINPFGKKSGFNWLVENNATILLFGASVRDLTFIHYVEEVSGKPLYRYDKLFPGKIVNDGSSRDCEFSMHVRPMGANLDYNWSLIEADLRAENILKQSKYSENIKWLNAHSLKNFWCNKITNDPFYFIDERSKQHFEKATQGGRFRVTQAQYENI